jgi:hypothetical protein
MTHRFLLRHGAALAAATFGLVQTADAAVDLPGPGAASFEWAPAAGPVAGYFVYVSNNGGPQLRYSTVSSGTSETVHCELGDAIVVSVMAFDAQGNEGPVSPPSELVRFVEDPGSEPPGEPPPGDPPEKATLLDFDADGFSDLLLRNRDTGQARIWSVAKSGLLEGEALLFDWLGRPGDVGEVGLLGESALPDLPAGHWIVGNGDYDGDGFADVLLREESTGNLHLWLIRDGAVAAEVAMAESPAVDWEVAGSADYDGDGRDDILLRNRGVGRLEIWRLDGTEIVGVTELDDPFGEGSEVVGTGDYDGDDRADILWQSGADLTIWLLGGTSEALEVALSVPSASWEVVGTGDYDGDGQSDILECDRDTGRLVVALVVNGEVIHREHLDSRDYKWRQVVSSGDYDGDGRTDILLGYGPNILRRHRILFMNEPQNLNKGRLPRLYSGWFIEGVGEEGLAIYR